MVPPTRLHARVVDILRQGMEVIRARTVLPTAATTDDRLPYRVMEVWAFFFGTVLPYVEGVFLPLQVELRSVGVSMRVLALATFRDGVILDIVDRLQVGFQRVLVDPVESRRAPDTIPRMLQMLTVLAELRDEQHAVVDAVRLVMLDGYASVMNMISCAVMLLPIY